MLLILFFLLLPSTQLIPTITIMRPLMNSINQYDLHNSNNCPLTFLFVNPHIHHSYFTALALSRIGSVEILCPPLLIALVCRRYHTVGLNLKLLTKSSLIVHPISLLIFLLYKARIISDKLYVNSLNILSVMLCKTKTYHYIYTYQDYMNQFLSTVSTSSTTIVEQIINTDPCQDNYLSSLRAFQMADIIICPTNDMLNQPYITTKPSYAVNYGGDKMSYMNFPSIIESSSPQPRNSINSPDHQYLVTVRANNIRKGLDIFLDAIDELFLFRKITPNVCFVIAGHVSDADSIARISQLNLQLSTRSSSFISMGQLDPHKYFLLLNNSDFFIMPSRLEGSGLAALEALWHCVPSLISTECGACVFRNKRHGILLSPNSSSMLASAIYSLLTDSTLLPYYKSCLKQDRINFTWHNYISQLPYCILSNV